jgi:uncharacterized phage protein (TIGR02220 family)
MIQKILGQSAFWIVNKSIARFTGIESAVLLADLIDKQGYFEARNELDPEGYFYNTADNIEVSTSLTYHCQKKCLNQLKDIGFVQTKLKGIPAKLHFKVIESKILNFLNTGFEESPKQEQKEVETNKNSINENKNENKILDLFHSQTVPLLSKDVLKMLNENKPSKIPFEPTKANLSAIEARIKEKFKLDDFKKVIDHKVSEWRDDPKMKKYIRPATLFGDKFNGYLVEAHETKSDGSGNFQFNPTSKAELL